MNAIDEINLEVEMYCLGKKYTGRFDNNKTDVTEDDLNLW